MKPVLRVVPDAPKTLLERYADLADSEYARAEALQERVRIMESGHPSLGEIGSLRSELATALTRNRELRAAFRQALLCHRSGDIVGLEEILKRALEGSDGSPR